MGTLSSEIEQKKCKKADFLSRVSMQHHSVHGSGVWGHVPPRNF